LRLAVQVFIPDHLVTPGEQACTGHPIMTGDCRKGREMGEPKDIDLNADVGESYGAFSHGSDTQIFQHITSANIACGWHAGDPVVMRRSVELARQYGVSIGAHPGFPDLLGFGRRDMAIAPDEAKQYVIYQASALAGFARAVGLQLQHIKLHGALYNKAMQDAELARAVIDGICESHPAAIILALPGSAMIEEALRAGLKTAREAFADRAYLADGRLAPRNLEGSVIQDPQAAADRALAIVTEGRVKSISGETVEVSAESICIHGDNPRAAAIAIQIRQALAKSHIRVRALHEFV